MQKGRPEKTGRRVDTEVGKAMFNDRIRSDLVFTTFLMKNQDIVIQFECGRKSGNKTFRPKSGQSC